MIGGPDRVGARAGVGIVGRARDPRILPDDVAVGGRAVRRLVDVVAALVAARGAGAEGAPGAVIIVGRGRRVGEPGAVLGRWERRQESRGAHMLRAPSPLEGKQRLRAHR
jgi:hypothetical protein